MHTKAQKKETFNWKINGAVPDLQYPDNTKAVVIKTKRWRHSSDGVAQISEAVPKHEIVWRKLRKGGGAKKYVVFIIFWCGYYQGLKPTGQSISLRHFPVSHSEAFQSVTLRIFPSVTLRISSQSL